MNNGQNAHSFTEKKFGIESETNILYVVFMESLSYI